MDLSGVAWRKSSYSGGNGGQCVEVAAIGRGGAGQGALCLARDSKDPEGMVLAFDRQSWSRFFADVKVGKFDVL